jgi:hypothetical protein
MFLVSHYPARRPTTRWRRESQLDRGCIRSLCDQIHVRVWRCSSPRRSLDGTALYDLFCNLVRDMPAKCRAEWGLAYKDCPIWRLEVEDVLYDFAALLFPPKSSVAPAQGGRRQPLKTPTENIRSSSLSHALLKSDRTSRDKSFPNTLEG